jgi:hypothetical protein
MLIRNLILDPHDTMMMARCFWPKTVGWCWVLDPEMASASTLAIVAMAKLERCGMMTTIPAFPAL